MYRTLAALGVPRSVYYAWKSRDDLQDRTAKPCRVYEVLLGLTDSGPVIFRSRNGALPASPESLHDAALASSAAPTIFPPHTIGDQHFVDGGLIANSPDALALTEAKAVLGWPLRTLHLLSVGTTAIETGLPYQPHTARWGILRWGWKLTLLDQLMAAQAKLSRQSARTSLGSRFCAGRCDSRRGPGLYHGARPSLVDSDSYAPRAGRRRLAAISRPRGRGSGVFEAASALNHRKITASVRVHSPGWRCFAGAP